MTLKAIFIYKPMWRILQMWVESPYIIITPTVIIIITRRTTVFISAKMKHTMRRYDFSLNWRLSFITYFDGILISINITIFSPSIFPWNDTCEKKIESTNMKKFTYITSKKDNISLHEWRNDILILVFLAVYAIAKPDWWKPPLFYYNDCFLWIAWKVTRVKFLQLWLWTKLILHGNMFCCLNFLS